MASIVLQRRLWSVSTPVLVAVTLAVGAASVARIVQLRRPDDAAPRRAAPAQPAHSLPPVAQVQPVPRGDAGAMVERNMFCSSCRPIDLPPGGAGPVATTHVQPRLVATQVAVIGGGWATIVDAHSGLGGAFPLGATLPGGGVLAAVRVGSIDVRFPDGAVEAVALAGDAATTTTTTGTASRAAASAPSDPWADRVRKLGDDRFEVDRALISELVGSGAAGRVKGVRIAPYVVDGNLAGVRVAAAARGSLATALGLEPGDVISEVDGRALDSTDALMKLYNRLDGIDHVDLGVTRKGARRTLAYDLH